MLPDIIEVAENYSLVIDPNTIGKKETMAQCPFCGSTKHHLSLNKEKRVFKCWSCNKSGGVLQFEAMLSNKPQSEIREKYFGKNKKRNKHPAYNLSPQQLKTIGWHTQKRDAFNQFVKNRDDVLLDWKRYEYEELVKYYAIFILISEYPFKEQVKEHYQWFLNEIKESKVENITERIIHAYQNKQNFNWVVRGKEIARMAYKSCVEAKDEQFVNLFPNVMLIIELLKVRNQKSVN